MQDVAANPLLATWESPFAVPPFAQIAPEHFPPAFEAALGEHRAEVDAIRDQATGPDFDNTIAAMERAGERLKRTVGVFFNLSGAHTNPEIQKIEREIAPKLSRHSSAIHLDPKLFARIAAIFEARESAGLTSEQIRLIERYHLGFTRAGAHLGEAERARLAEIAQRLAELGTAFSQNVLADESGFTLVLEGEADIAGLPDFLIKAAARAARDRDLGEGQYVITLARSSIEPFLQFSERRDLREKAFRAWTMRGDGTAHDNAAIMSETLRLRDERAKLLGYADYAAYKLDDTMAKTPQAVSDLLSRVWKPAVARADAERDALAALARAEGANDAIAPWDWRYYAEKERQRAHALEEAEIKPYFQLDNIIQAAFHVAQRLFGLQFTPRDDVPVYHPDVRAWEVLDAQGAHMGLFYGDYFARASKRSGAWASSYRGQRNLDERVRPIIVNVMNFSAPAEGEPALLSFDDARTLFHEFGHALHGLLSDVTYPSLAGTNVSRDFVELPSQLYEHWLEVPEILERFAVHAQTGKPMPAGLRERLAQARNFNQGFATVEYCASALVDLDMHAHAEDAAADPIAFERAALSRIGMPDAIEMRHRSPHFAHIFSGEGYSAGYYSYLWSEVLDADAFAAFTEAGDPFDPQVAQRLHDFIYAAGNLRDPEDAYRGFRDRLPDVGPLLEKRGLA
ncbi:M3 family metallopeptidase [Saliniramus sp.]|uniref:M3 family metallopeptidase n=1 Tax=Saliniramus sp. TaxID=2986772 RepID=UPI002C7D9629|nr:M3 family metallopeptidase [Saliniramus sp.]HMB11743.1 M3 family metallopeptidase [Saliniramus sp.]